MAWPLPRNIPTHLTQNNHLETTSGVAIGRRTQYRTPNMIRPIRPHRKQPHARWLRARNVWRRERSSSHKTSASSQITRELSVWSF